MDQIGERLTAEFERTAKSRGRQDDALVGLVMRGARVRRAKRVSSAAAFVVVLGVAVGALANTIGDGLSTPEPGTSPGPTYTTDGPQLPHPDGTYGGTFAPPIDDGIAADEYPPAAADRGAGFPTAFDMQDWVWDKVGTGWGLMLVSAGAPRPVMYLLSPEGAAFELAELPAAATDHPAIVTWQEAQRTARIVWGDGSEGALVDLRTGALDPIAFTQDGVPSTWIQFVSASADGTEIWAGGNDGWAGSKRRNYAWTPDGEWTRILRGREDLAASTFAQAASPDDGSVVYVAATKGSRYATATARDYGQPELVYFNVSARTKADVTPAYPAGAKCGEYFAWTGLTSIVLQCSRGADVFGLAIDFASGQATQTAAPGDHAELPTAEELAALGVTEVRGVDGGAVGLALVAANGAQTLVNVADIAGARDLAVTAVARVSGDTVRLRLGNAAYVYFDTASGAYRVLPLHFDGAAEGAPAATISWFGEVAEPRAGQPQRGDN